VIANETVEVAIALVNGDKFYYKKLNATTWHRKRGIMSPFMIKR